MTSSVCVQCGAALHKDVKFCPSCGAAVTATSAGPPPGPTGPPPGPSGPPPGAAAPVAASPKKGLPLRTVASFASLALGMGTSGYGLWRTLNSDEGAGQKPPVAAISPEATPIETEQPSVESPSPAAAESATCSNSNIGYSLEYPIERFTGFNNPGQECRFFDDQPVTVAQPAAATEAAIVITPLNVAYQDWVDSFEQEGITIIERFELVVGGLPTTVTEFSFVGDESGAINYTYDIDHDGVLSLFANSVYSDDFELTKQTLNAMAASLVFQ